MEKNIAYCSEHKILIFYNFSTYLQFLALSSIQVSGWKNGTLRKFFE